MCPSARPQVPLQVSQLKQPHYVHDYVHLDLYVQSVKIAFKTLSGPPN